MATVSAPAHASTTSAIEVVVKTSAPPSSTATCSFVAPRSMPTKRLMRGSVEGGVQVAGPEPLEVERDVAVAGAVHGGDDVVASRQRGVELVDGELETGEVAVVAHPQLAEPECAQRRLGGGDLGQDGERHRRAVRDA